MEEHVVSDLDRAVSKPCEGLHIHGFEQFRLETGTGQSRSLNGSGSGSYGSVLVVVVCQL